MANFCRSFYPQTFEKKMRGLITYYQYYAQNNGEYVLLKEFRNDSFLIDGHPTFVNNSSLMVTDTYPDKNKIQRLLMFDQEKNKVYELGKFNATYQGNPASCDLHPKVSRDGQYVVVDSAHDEKHHMIVLKIK